MIVRLSPLWTVNVIPPDGTAVPSIVPDPFAIFPDKTSEASVPLSVHFAEIPHKRGLLISNGVFGKKS